MEIRIPELGESITEGTVSKWMVHVGEQVNQGDVIAEIETDKVNMELMAEEAGYVREIRRQEGETVKIGEVIAVLDNARPADNKAEQPAASENKSAAEPAAEPAPPAPAKAAPATSAVQGDLPDGADVLATPSARKFAREHGIALGQLTALKALGRVDVHDLQALSSQPAYPNVPDDAQSGQEPASAANRPAMTDHSAGNADKPVERIRMSRRRQTIAKRLVEVQHNAAMLTTFNEIDMTAVMELRSRRKDAFLKKHGVKLGFMSFFTKAVVGALKAFPLLNAEIQDSDLLLKKFYDIGIAVSTDDGLVVPVVRDADKLSLAGLEREIASLADKARNNRLKITDLEGGTFTITNGGVFGSLLSTPILNPPQVGILGMHKIQTRPVTMPDNRMENRPMMYVALSYDHRVIDGKEAVSFLVRVKELLEDPESLMFDI